MQSSSFHCVRNHCAAIIFKLWGLFKIRGQIFRLLIPDVTSHWFMPANSNPHFALISCQKTKEDEKRGRGREEETLTKAGHEVVCLLYNVYQ